MKRTRSVVVRNEDERVSFTLTRTSPADETYSAGEFVVQVAVTSPVVPGGLGP